MIRGNLMMTKARQTRWHHQQEPSCDTCGRRETLAHCLQTCPRSCGARIKRHNRIVELIRRALERKGYETIEEPIIKTGRGIRKPDLVATKEGRSWILDAAVTGDNTDLDWRRTRRRPTTTPMTRVEVSPLKIAKRCKICGEFE